MAPTADEILFAIDELASCRGREEWFCALGDEPVLRAALRAVVELHAPRPCTQPCSLRHEHLICRERGSGCSTIRVIAKELGVEVKDEERIEKEERRG